MMIWFMIAALVVITSILFALDPRRLRVGIALLATISLIALAVIALISGELSNSTKEIAAWFFLGFLAIGLLSIGILASFLIYTGLAMTRRKTRRRPNLLMVLLGIGLVGYAGVGFLAIVQNSPGILIWILFSIPPLLYLGFAFASFLLYSWLYGRLTRRFGGTVSSIIILGAGLDGDRVTPILASRLALGKTVFDRLVASGCRPTMIVSGGQGEDQIVSEAEAMSAWLVDAGVPESVILREDASSSTEENLRYSKALRDEHGITGESAIVTNNFHAFRAATYMSRLGMGGYALGSPTAMSWWPVATLREFVALLRIYPRVNAVILGVLCIPFLAFLFASLV